MIFYPAAAGRLEAGVEREAPPRDIISFKAVVAIGVFETAHRRVAEIRFDFKVGGDFVSRADATANLGHIEEGVVEVLDTGSGYAEGFGDAVIASEGAEAAAQGEIGIQGIGKARARESNVKLKILRQF